MSFDAPLPQIVHRRAAFCNENRSSLLYKCEGYDIWSLLLSKELTVTQDSREVRSRVAILALMKALAHNATPVVEPAIICRERQLNLKLERFFCRLFPRLSSRQCDTDVFTKAGIQCASTLAVDEVGVGVIRSGVSRLSNAPQTLSVTRGKVETTLNIRFFLWHDRKNLKFFVFNVESGRQS